MVDDGSDEIGGFEDFEVAFGCVMTLGAVDDGLGGGVPGDFLEGEGMAQEVFRQMFAPGVILGGNGFFATVVDVEAGVFPAEEVGEAAGADVFAVALGVEVFKKPYFLLFDGACGPPRKPRIYRGCHRQAMGQQAA